MEKLEFNPKTGWLDTASFPNKQGEQANRNMLNNLHMQTRDFINKLVEDLETATEDRGSALIGAYAIEGLLNEDETEAVTVQQQINALKKLLDSNDASLNDEIVVIKEDLEALDTKVEGYNTTLDEKIDSSVETLDTRITSEVETLNESIDLKANSNDVYTKTETNEKLDAKSDKNDVYTRNDVDTLLATKIDLSNVYTKDAIDSKVDMQHGALASLNDIFSGGGNIQIIGGVGITVVVDNANKRIIVNATGEAQPGAHALSHTINGTDPIQSKELFYGDNTLEEVVEGIKTDLANAKSDISSTQSEVDNITSGVTVVPNATNAVNAENATNSVNATNATLLSGKAINDIYTSDDIVIENSKVSIKGVDIANRGTMLDETLLASGWVDDTYSLTISGVTTTSVQEILPSVLITNEQLESLQGANIQDGGQSPNTIILKAFGDVPTIDIPIRVILRGDM